MCLLDREINVPWKRQQQSLKEKAMHLKKREQWPWKARVTHLETESNVSWKREQCTLRESYAIAMHLWWKSKNYSLQCGWYKCCNVTQCHAKGGAYNAAKNQRLLQHKRMLKGRLLWCKSRDCTNPCDRKGEEEPVMQKGMLLQCDGTWKERLLGC